LVDEVRLAAAFAAAVAVALLATPAAIRVARRTDFLDHPRDYKKHGGATPYLGGAAVVSAVLVAVIAFGNALDGGAVLAACILGLFAVGTLDDRHLLPVLPRVAAEVGAAAALYAAGLGWEPLGSEAANVGLTILLVVGVINAYNLMDNLDGAAGTVALVTGLGLGGYLAAEGSVALAVLGFAIAGACAGFLPYNLAPPAARIFLGDGGSIPIGLGVAVLLANVPVGAGFDWELIPLTAVLAGLPALDTALVTISRRRRGVSVMSGGRDHLTHRLQAIVGSPRRVAAALALGQGACIALGIALLQLEPAAEVVGAVAVLLAGLGIIAALEYRPGAPGRPEAPRRRPSPAGAGALYVSPDDG
jgi:UDP-GlcNAc:undecaprenyl-phosphate GlcNAc-1-phosphate transferase